MFLLLPARHRNHEQHPYQRPAVLEAVSAAAVAGEKIDNLRQSNGILHLVVKDKRSSRPMAIIEPPLFVKNLQGPFWVVAKMSRQPQAHFKHSSLIGCLYPKDDISLVSKRIPKRSHSFNEK